MHVADGDKLAATHRRVVVVGHGPVGHALLERLVEEAELPLLITVFSECQHLAYNRVMMTSFFKHRSVERLSLCTREWCDSNGVRLLFAPVVDVDRQRKRVAYKQSGANRFESYDELVFATGSAPFIPPVPGLSLDVPGIFVYRTITDMEKMIERARGCHSAAVIGGGLLGLEAAKALRELKLESHIFEVAPHLMPAQVGQSAGMILRSKVEALRVTVHTSVQLLEVHSDDTDGVGALRFIEAGEEVVLAVDLLVVSCGVRPRDELARVCGLELGAKGGVKVDTQLRSSSDPHIYAVGEVASLNGAPCYGLWAPGVEQARVLASTLGCPRKNLRYHGSDLSTKLKLLGVDIASFGGDASFWTSRLFDLPSNTDITGDIFSIVASDASAGVCRRLVFQRMAQGSCRLLGGVLVGDVGDYSMLRDVSRSGRELSSAESMILAYGPRGALWQLRRGVPPGPAAALVHALQGGDMTQSRL